VSLAICAGDVGVVRSDGRRVVQAESLPVAAGNGAVAWGEALDAYETWLAADKRRGHSVRATVSAVFSRLCSVPWTDRRLNPEQDQAWVRLQFESAYGDMDGWTVQAEPGGYGRARLACALPTDLVDRWHAICRSRRLTGGSMQPYAVTAWNRWRQLVRPGQLWSVAERDRVVWAVRGQGGWDSVGLASQRVSAEVLPQVAEREQRLRGASNEGGVVIHAPGLVALPALHVANVRWLSASSEAEPMSVAMARTVAAA
jgi:hypothetical protein